MGPIFSVVVPTYNRPSSVARAVSSVLAQTVADLECLVVDDGSVELPSLPEDDRVRLIPRSARGGPSAARNTGAREAKARFLAFLDDDDAWLPNRLELGLAALARAPLGVCWSRFQDERPRPKVVLDGMVQDRIVDAITPHLGGAVVERERFLPFDEAFEAAEDVDWWLRITANVPVATVPKVGCLLARATGMTTGRERWSSNTRLIEKHQDYFDRHPRAAAFRWARVGLAAVQADEVRIAEQAFKRSLRIRPSVLATTHLIAVMASRRPTKAA
jgi:glycosyltransferase involved in cell wall biosynthesis